MALGNVLITGGSSGIGLACALRLAARGYHVYAGVRSTTAGEEVCGMAHGIRPVILDVRHPASIHDALSTIGGEPLAGLINSAGVAILGPLEMVSVEEWRYQFEVNVLGSVAISQACLPQLRRGKGRIVNIGSIAGRSALPGTGAYDSSKFAIEGISDSLRLELRAFGVHVALVEPGAIATKIWQKSVAELDKRYAEVAPDIRNLYSHLTSRIREEAVKSEKRALAPETVAKAVEHAMTAAKPKRRYVVGKDAKLELLLNLLPHGIQDWLIFRDLCQ
jgi:NAD(P)-dependent dehydrogenase (short-subunit alcohol dehydrogenase family)